MDNDAVMKTIALARSRHLAGRLQEAEAFYRQALGMSALAHAAFHGLGILALQVQQPDRAVEFYAQAIRLAPDQMAYWNNYGEALRQTGRVQEAIEAIGRACRMNPRDANALYNLGRALMDQQDYGAAKEAFSRAISINPADHETINNLGIVLQNLGRSQEALELFSRAKSLARDLIPGGNYVQMMNYLPFSSAEIASAHKAWGQTLEKHFPRVAIPPRAPHQRPRVGYLSSSIRNHAVARFLMSVLKSHDHARFEIYAYVFGRIHDNFTDRAKSFCDHWRDIQLLGDDQAAGQILADEIDILVDLDGHTSDNRVGILARKPAPIQVSWLGYQNTTGLSAVDYRLTDAHVDPVGLTDPYYTEKLHRLGGAFYCYEPPELNLSTDFRGHDEPTFGSANNLMKISAPVLETWARILEQTRAKLVLTLPGKADDPEYQRLLEPFAAKGVADRVTFVGRRNYADYLDGFARIDVSLDPFPCVGHTTTCDALWMGCPVLTLAGEDYRSRLGASVLGNLGLDQWIARDIEEYVQKAVEMARSVSTLRAGRAQLRKRLVDSVLCDAPGFTRKLEAFYQSVARR